MFTLHSWKQIAKSLRTAEQIKPQVKVEAEGVYQVSGRNNTQFTVICCKDEEGQRIVACQCVAGAKLHTPCFHAAAAIKAHVSLVTWNQPTF